MTSSPPPIEERNHTSRWSKPGHMTSSPQRLIELGARHCPMATWPFIALQRMNEGEEVQVCHLLLRRGCRSFGSSLSPCPPPLLLHQSLLRILIWVVWHPVNIIIYGDIVWNRDWTWNWNLNGMQEFRWELGLGTREYDNGVRNRSTACLKHMNINVLCSYFFYTMIVSYKLHKSLYFLFAQDVIEYCVCVVCYSFLFFVFLSITVVYLCIVHFTGVLSIPTMLHIDIFNCIIFAISLWLIHEIMDDKNLQLQHYY